MVQLWKTALWQQFGATIDMLEREFLLSLSWGTPLKPLAFRGELCFGPSQGQQVTFVNPRAWFDIWQDIDPQLALQHMARRGTWWADGHHVPALRA